MVNAVTIMCINLWICLEIKGYFGQYLMIALRYVCMQYTVLIRNISRESGYENPSVGD